MLNPTVKDVARDAGVSVGTVSRVLAKNETVNPAIRQRVEEVIERLGYRPNSLGRSLRLNKSDIIGLVIPDITNPFFAELAKHLETLASAAGYSVLLANTHEDPKAERKQVQSLLGRAPAGIVIAPVSGSLVGEILPDGVVSVAIDRGLTGHSLVATDNFEGGRLAASHLLELGHRRIGYISGPSTTDVSIQRLNGFRGRIEETFSNQSQHVVELTVLEGNFDYKSGEAIGRQLLLGDIKQRPTAIATANDQQAIGLLRASRDLGIRVPEDLSIVGFDDIPLASLVLPRLTTVRQPLEEMAEIAVRAVLRGGAIMGLVTLKPALVERDSTAAPPAR
ncbi:LacI family transcriptional regulator [Pararhizobium sp. BT-229]|uniref:LacI family DNA-binding transcriptional regulator n=1 Tax=Pararhizobium sp. BT-229 TaxID=2986923 RepID=UPI0021F6B590|nr:LacI family DNA-binding transcriptional regulator [Pararhizobium sp. BT-229]MCV9961795.1 LacI family transcriptional regulator [Pararhizobium sp. BT-229]